jgi:hypothetical protein
MEIYRSWVVGNNAAFYSEKDIPFVQKKKKKRYGWRIILRVGGNRKTGSYGSTLGSARGWLWGP